MKFSTEELLQGILAQDKRILGKAITLIESKKPEHRVLAEELLKKIDNVIYESRADSVMTKEEKAVGQSFDYSI